MGLFLAALGTLAAGGLLALASSRSARTATWMGAGGTIVGCGLGLAAALRALARGTVSLRADWDVPYGSFSLEIDALSAFFMLPLFGLSALAAVYGAAYLDPARARRSLGPPWFFFALLVASMALVVAARNGVLFLVAWEVMSLASFFLVTFEDEKEEVREAGWTYLVAMHLGTAFLLAFFAMLGKGTGSLDFDRFATPAAPAAGALFILALVGFGTKAGLMPFHVWLPEAHPAAPSHVSALMSGVMIKMGVYGLFRTLTLLGPPPAWWGGVLLAIGALSAVLGILFALAQHDLKRVLAYSSVENVGIIAMGLGLGVLGLGGRSPAMAVLGFAGALLHVLNHAAAKGLLFLGAGAVLHETGTRTIDRLGGLLKRMPRTGAAFLVGSAAICGLPPLNGFAGEVLLLAGALKGGVESGVQTGLAAFSAIGALALVAGLAAACFAKVFGAAFLGEPRTREAREAHEPAAAMRVPLLILAALCLALGLLAWVVTPALAPILERLGTGPAADRLAAAGRLLASIALGGGGVLVLAALLAGLRRALLSGRTVGETVTWDCGYARPTARMQYTSSSFAQPLTDLFRMLLRTRRRLTAPEGLFPPGAVLTTETPDLAREGLFGPAFRSVRWGASKLRWLQLGRVHLYVLYIALTLIALLAWKLA